MGVLLHLLEIQLALLERHCVHNEVFAGRSFLLLHARPQAVRRRHQVSALSVRRSARSFYAQTPLPRLYRIQAQQRSYASTGERNSARVPERPRERAEPDRRQPVAPHCAPGKCCHRGSPSGQQLSSTIRYPRGLKEILLGSVFGARALVATALAWIFAVDRSRRGGVDCGELVLTLR